MRTALVWIGLAGCSLYFGEPHHHEIPLEPDAQTPPVVADAPTQWCQWYKCEDGVVYHAQSTPVQAGSCASPTLDGATVIETCADGCQFTNFYQAGPTSPCAYPPPPTFDCTMTGACTPTSTHQCSAQLEWGQVLATGTCTCSGDGTWACVPQCSDGLCTTTDVQQALVGTWTGTATPLLPGFPAPPWTLALTIAADHTWTGVTSLSYRDPFYYGGTGGGADKVFIQAQTTLGAVGVLRVFYGEQDGEIVNVHVDAHHLTFTFVAAWLDNDFAFAYDLTR